MARTSCKGLPASEILAAFPALAQQPKRTFHADCACQGQLVGNLHLSEKEGDAGQGFPASAFNPTTFHV
jgi:hypothetical protein